MATTYHNQTLRDAITRDVIECARDATMASVGQHATLWRGEIKYGSVWIPVTWGWESKGEAADDARRMLRGYGFGRAARAVSYEVGMYAWEQPRAALSAREG